MDEYVGMACLHTALDWLAANHASPAIATLSLGVPEGKWSTALSDTVKTLIEDHAVSCCLSAVSQNLQMHNSSLESQVAEAFIHTETDLLMQMGH